MTGSNTSIIGYDPAKSSYFAQGFDSMGARNTASVTFGAKTMTHDITRVDARGNEYLGRCTFQLTAPTLTYECEVLTDGKWWISAKGEGTRIR